MTQGIKNHHVAGLISAIANALRERFPVLPEMLRTVVSKVVLDYLFKNNLLIDGHRLPAFSGQQNEVRAIFEEMHLGRDLRKHHLRETYLSPQIAALWNQHLKTIDWMLEKDKEEA